MTNNVFQEQQYGNVKNV